MTDETLPVKPDAVLPAVEDSRAATLAIADELGITDEYVLGQLRTVVDLALQGYALHDKDGNWLADVPQFGHATRALELLAKHRGLLTERSETHHTGGIDIRIIGVNTDTLT